MFVNQRNQPKVYCKQHSQMVKLWDTTICNADLASAQQTWRDINPNNCLNFGLRTTA